MPGLSSGVNSSAKSPLFVQEYTCITNRQTDGNAISIVEHVIRDAF